MSELTCLELSVLLWVAHVLCQAVTVLPDLGITRGAAYMFSPRDTEMVAKGLVCGRAVRALANYVENLVPFVAVNLALIATQHTGGIGAIGATIWILARIVYLPIYLLGIIYVRTAVWVISIIGLLMMLGRLVGY